jgi:protein gp37
VFLDERDLTAPLCWRKTRMIFVRSMTDLFADFVPDEWIDKVFAVMALCPQHSFQVLTKRPARAREYFGRDEDGFMPAEARIEHRAKQIAREWGSPVPPGKTLLGQMPFPHVWLGTSCSDQASADARIPDLLAAPAAVRFLSAEPLLGPMDVRPYMPNDLWNNLPSWKQPELDWVIVGGESGRNARPMHPDWARSLRDQCQAAGVAFFFKQWGEWADQSDDKVTGHNHRILLPTGETIGVGCKWGGAVEEGWKERGGAWMTRVGKKRAGRLLDGREWNEVPQC